ncbi:hypothetical protein [Hansschlegelia sp.]|uniref:hypothetical protein n=1 Tax=Hansschlegelia sp. TaxID=2041892 RepID=UPI002B885E92|nr:hypothetical protein [Hansschlegelia sp.]HVI28672.1 hypothetical protein [Hansschlegelia sp.]
MHANADADIECPVSLELLGRLHRADPSLISEMVRPFSEGQRARLALFCYSRSHLRDVAMTIAASCEAGSLVRLAGTVGQIMTTQSEGAGASFGNDPFRPGALKRKVTLATSAA